MLKATQDKKPYAMAKGRERNGPNIDVSFTFMYYFQLTIFTATVSVVNHKICPYSHEQIKYSTQTRNQVN